MKNIDDKLFEEIKEILWRYVFDYDEDGESYNNDDVFNLIKKLDEVEDEEKEE